MWSNGEYWWRFNMTLGLLTIDMNSPNWEVRLNYNLALIDDKIKEIALNLYGSEVAVLGDLSSTEDSASDLMTKYDADFAVNVNSRMAAIENMQIIIHVGPDDWSMMVIAAPGSKGHDTRKFPGSRIILHHHGFGR